MLRRGRWLAEQLRELGVQAGPDRVRDLLVDRARQQRVAEAGPAVVGPQEPGPQGFGGGARGIRQRKRGHFRAVQVAAGGRGELHEHARRAGQPAGGEPDGAGHPGRKIARVEVSRLGARGPCGLGRQQRAAGGELDDLADRGLGEVGRGPDELANGIVGEAFDADLGGQHAARAQRAEDCVEVLAARQVTPGQDQQHG